MGFYAEIRGRSLILIGQGHDLLSVPFDQGGRYRVVVPDVTTHDQVLLALESVQDTAVLSPDGGLLGAMTVGSNLSLALGYGHQANGAAVSDWEQALHGALLQCGLSETRIQQLGRELPMNLDRVERWLVGFVRYLLRPPELLILDQAFANLSRLQANAVLTLEALYHDFNPFRPTLLLDIDAHGLPPVADCRVCLELEALACPS